MSLSPITLTAAPRSAVTHGVDARNLATHPSHSTICGREILDTWTGEMSEETTPGVPTCKACARNMDAGYPRTARDAGTLTTDADTGDTLASYAGCIVADRFTDRADAVAFLAGDRTNRPLSCSRHGEDTSGSCLREAGHPGLHLGACGYRWDESVRWDHGAVRRFPRYARFSEEGSESGRFPGGVLSRWSRWVKVDGMWTHPEKIADRAAAELRDACEAAGIPTGTDGWPVIGHRVYAENVIGTGVILETVRAYGERARARSMAAHPAGKGRIRMGSTVEIVAPGFRDNGRTGRVVNVSTNDDTVSVKLVGESIPWAWHRTMVAPINVVLLANRPSVR